MNKKITYILIGIIVVTFGIVSAIEIRDNQNQPTKEYKEKTDGAKNTKKIENTKTEKEIIREKIAKRNEKDKKEIDKIKEIVGAKTYISTHYLEPFTYETLKKEDLSTQAKINSVVDYKILSSYYPNPPETKKIEWEAEYNGEKHIETDNVSFILKTELASLYKEIYNEEIPEYDPSEIKLQNGCPIYIKNDNEYIYFHLRCGGSSEPSINQVHIYNTIEENNTFTIYYALLFSQCVENCNYSKDVTLFDIYTDKDKTNLYKEKVKEDFCLTDDNYKDFTQYKVVFEKLEDGRYIFKESIKIQ